MKNISRTGGLASWSINHPVAVTMLALSVLVVGLLSLGNLKINLLPELVYPEIQVRVLQPGSPVNIMEDQITRQLEEQLAITEGLVSVQSSTSPGRSSVSLSFPYGSDIDLALREASTRLDRAKRFLPDNIAAPTIYKRDPSQIPVMEFIVSSDTLDLIQLRNWVDYEFSRWFITIPGVASTEVGGGLIREIQILLDDNKLARLNLTYQDIQQKLADANIDLPGGTFHGLQKQFNTQVNGRYSSVGDILSLPLKTIVNNNTSRIIRLEDVAQIIDTHADEKLRIRLNGKQGVKLSIQKQPQANTVAVVDEVMKKLQWFRQQHLLPDNITIEKVGDQSTYVRYALRNTAMAALSGALLAMLVVYLFLGDLRRTLIISSAIPLAILITLSIMNVSGLSLNIMSLGGLALGIGILVDNTIVMLENISRHQQQKADPQQAAIDAAAEVSSAITASTSTNLAAIIPFLFIGGLIALLFNEFIITLSAAILASLAVAMTLVPALGAQLKNTPLKNSGIRFKRVQHIYSEILKTILQKPFTLIFISLLLLIISIVWISQSRASFFPKMDEGRISISVRGNPGIELPQLDKAIKQIETIINQNPDVQSSFTTAGGFVFGRSEYQFSHRGSIIVQLKPLSERTLSSQDWVKQLRKKVKNLHLIDFSVSMRVRGVRGARLSQGDDDLSIRIQGDSLTTLSKLGDELIEVLSPIKGIRNLEHNQQDQMEELQINIRHSSADALSINSRDIAQTLNTALNGAIVSDFIDGDRQYDIRLKLRNKNYNSIEKLKDIIISVRNQQNIRLGDVANIKIISTPRYIKRDNQRRILEVSASLQKGYTMDEVMEEVNQKIKQMNLPAGYSIYDAGSLKQLRQNEHKTYILLALALFLVFVVMAVQYESFKNPFIIMLAALFTSIGVAMALQFSLHNILTMPAKIGIIMLVGIVVNNSIVLVEQIEIQRQKGDALFNAITEAARLRLRPILMTSITTVAGMLPLAIGLGDGSEMLKPMAIIIVYGLSFSMLVSLFLLPLFYQLFYRRAKS